MEDKKSKHVAEMSDDEIAIALGFKPEILFLVENPPSVETQESIRKIRKLLADGWDHPESHFSDRYCQNFLAGINFSEKKIAETEEWLKLEHSDSDTSAYESICVEAIDQDIRCLCMDVRERNYEELDRREKWEHLMRTRLINWAAVREVRKLEDEAGMSEIKGQANSKTGDKK